MKIAYITAGAGGMYCGSCMKDNTLARALNELGHECLLIPCYTPLRLDESEANHSSIFLSGLTLYLEQNYSWLRHIPKFLARFLAQPWLLRKVANNAVKIEASRLAPMTLSLLRGTDGNQKQEVERLDRWLSSEIKPDIILMTNVLLSGIIPDLKQRLDVPIFTTLQGDDIFLQELPADSRKEAIELIRQNCEHTAGHIATCRYYADFMSQYLGVSREAIHIVYPGIDLQGFPTTATNRSDNNALTIGYLARIAPEKGFHVLVDALSVLNRRNDVPPWRFRFAGYLAGHRKDYLEEQRKKAESAGWGDRFEYIGEPDRTQKIRFLESVDLLSVPTTYQEPKGLYLLEAMACGVPVVMPRHGSFPEWIEATRGGVLTEPNDPASIAEGLALLLSDKTKRKEHGRAGQHVVHERFTAKRMAEETMKIISQAVRI
jgi:glycosyltransferase involved in cell wall biosynthesis